MSQNLLKNNVQKIIVNCITIFFLFLPACTSNKVEENEDKVIQEVVDFYKNDSLGSYYIHMFSKNSQKNWKDFLKNNFNKYKITNKKINIYLFYLPQYCSGCINEYRVVAIKHSEGEIQIFPLMEEYYYSRNFNQKESKVLENNLQIIFSKNNIVDRDEIEDFIDFLMLKLLKAKKVKSNDYLFLDSTKLNIKEEFSFKMKSIELSDTLEKENSFYRSVKKNDDCLKNVNSNFDKVKANLKSKSRVYYFYKRGIYEVIFAPEKKNEIKINFINASCFGDLLM